jgi:hypothetical protein
LYNPTLYTIPGYDIADLVIASYSDYPGGTQAIITKPSWANACSIILIGAGGSGAGGTQGFNPSPGQSKNAQQGNCGGGGGSGAILCLQKIINPALISLGVGMGGPGTGLDAIGTAGGATSIQIQSGSTIISCNAGGGGYGNIGQQEDNIVVGVGGIRGNPQFSTFGPLGPTIQHIDIYGVTGQNGSSPGPSNASQFTYCNGGSIDSSYYSNVLPIQIISNGGGNQSQSTLGTQYGVDPFPGSTGYGAGGAGGAGGTQGGPGPLGSTGGAGAPGFARIYWLNTA